MDQIIEFFRGLFSYDQWPPRWKCGYWSDFHGWMYIISDLMVWLAYFLIPLIIINYFSKKGTSIRFRKVYLLFATFILLCGSTHLIDALMFWVPMYRFNGIVRLATGIVSLLTVYHLFRALPDLFKQKTNLELEKEIARREEAERKLAEANQGLEAFVYIVSHDLQEPLRKIRTFTDLLHDGNKDKFDDRSAGYSTKIVSAAARMQTLIQDVLTLSTISEQIVLVDVDTNAAINTALDDLDMRILEKGAKIEIGELPRIQGHPVYLGQLFYNLFSNALKYNDKTPIVKVTGQREGDLVIIKVSDNGIGMNKDDFQRIFEPFQRLHKNGQYEGRGIGLAIVKKIVQVHGGTITVDSTLGEGTTFSITFNGA